MARTYSDKHLKPRQLTPRTLNSEKEYRRIKQILLRKTEDVDDTLKVWFDHSPNSHGWIFLDISTQTRTIRIRCSYAFEPFDDFVWWLEGIRFNKFPIALDIEEEGRYKKLFVYAVDEAYLRLIVIADNHYAQTNCTYKASDIVLDTVVRKEKLIAQFYHYGFKDFVEKRFKQDRWSDQNLHEILKRLKVHFDCSWDRWEGIHRYA